MQNSNPSRNSLSYPSLLQQLLERTLFGAGPATAGAVPTPNDISGANAALGDDPADDDTGVGVAADGDATETGDPGDAAGRLELGELLGVLRDPIAWVFTLAERRAQSDPVDIAAIHRVRDAVLSRVDHTIVGTPSASSPRIRSADLLTLAGLLIETLDPSLVQRAMQSVGTRIADALAAGLEIESMLAAQLARAAAPLSGADVPPPGSPSWYLGSIPARQVAPGWYGAAMPHAVPHGGPCVGPCPGAFAAPHALRPVVPPWYWPQSPFAF